MLCSPANETNGGIRHGYLQVLLFFCNHAFVSNVGETIKGLHYNFNLYIRAIADAVADIPPRICPSCVYPDALLLSGLLMFSLVCVVCFTLLCNSSVSVYNVFPEVVFFTHL